MNANQTVRVTMTYLLQYARAEGTMPQGNFPIKELHWSGPASHRRIWNLAPPLFGLILQG